MNINLIARNVYSYYEHLILVQREADSNFRIFKNNYNYLDSNDEKINIMHALLVNFSAIEIEVYYNADLVLQKQYILNKKNLREYQRLFQMMYIETRTYTKNKYDENLLELKNTSKEDPAKFGNYPLKVYTIAEIQGSITALENKIDLFGQEEFWIENFEQIFSCAHDFVKDQISVNNRITRSSYNYIDRDKYPLSTQNTNMRVFLSLLQIFHLGLKKHSRWYYFDNMYTRYYKHFNFYQIYTLFVNLSNKMQLSDKNKFNDDFNSVLSYAHYFAAHHFKVELTKEN